MMITSAGEKLLTDEANKHITCKVKITCNFYYDDKLLDVQEKPEITLYPQEKIVVTCNGVEVV
jgi:hypothetical protein